MSQDEILQSSLSMNDVSVVKELCRVFGVPPQRRKEVYTLLLNPLPQTIDPTKTVSVDQFLALYTPFYQNTLTETTQQLALCIGNLKGDEVALAQILLPLLSLNISNDILVGITQKITNVYIPLVLKENEKVTKGLTTLFLLLLQYHCPILSKKLVEIRADITQFILNKVCTLSLSLFKTIQGKLKAFDAILLSTDQILFFFVVLSHVILLQKNLVQAQNSEEVISILGNGIVDDEIDVTIAYAKGLSGNTPISVTKQIFACLNDSQQYENWVYESINTAPVVLVSPKDIFNDKSTRGLNLFFIDGRKKEEHLGGTIPGALNIDAETFETDPESALKLFKDIEAMKRGMVHIVVFGETDHRNQKEKIQQVVMWLVKNGFCRVSELHNGFYGYHYLFDNEKGYTIENHSITQCTVCRRQGKEGVNHLIKATENVGNKAFEFAKGWFGQAVASMTAQPTTSKNTVDVKDLKPTKPVDSKIIVKEVKENEEGVKEISKPQILVEDKGEEKHSESPIEKEQKEESSPSKPVEHKEEKTEKPEETNESHVYEELMEKNLHMTGEIITESDIEKVIVIATSREMIIIKGETGKHTLVKKIPLALLKKVSMKKATPDVLTFNGVPPHLPLTIKFEKVHEFLEFLKTRSGKKDQKK
ncbi:hypothetical protein EIN_129360 [Entamoeba invadens IP1]|uniref:Rhodanese domain-containing protein n=1 Tax=Entamoeba invadens IP1 TaxID=370355 RepID=L7FND2_ENTIV|nr:hypothetical protein EIN_129360 [Entamoeba invadens IP1]ELP91596.1 hypothetical protein EIN_129360 [Entamoeba invadens IP1]|eukprot:XP_004258367.1 hypothetical protein EIN_129360 [Entamoeba invadens IP1]